MIRIQYENEREIEIDPGDKTILEISLANDIPHVHACGGHARCSTCRVLIREHPENILPRSEAEAELALKKGFDEDIRLACQTKITGPVTIRRLVIDDEDIRDAAGGTSQSTGRERKLAILFSDVRNFTSFTEGNLPYDVVHTLNRYFAKMGKAVRDNSGYIDKYIGDGLMAIFGLDASDPKEVCLQAVRAALAMLSELEIVNSYLRNHLGVEFQIGIGIHYGDAIIGEIGHPDKRQFTALGDNVNFASRIESTTKRAKASLLVSSDVYEIIKDDVRRGRVFATQLKGKSGNYRLYEILAASGTTKASHGETIEAAPQRSFPARLIQRKEIARDTNAFEIKIDMREFEYTPGQYVEVGIPGSPDSRLFSIACAPRQDRTIIVATRMRPSDFKNALATLTPGAELLIGPPAGEFVLPEDDTPVVFLAGGIGVTPVRSMIEESMASNVNRRVLLFYANGRMDQVSFLGDFERWAKDNANFEFHPTLTRETPETWQYDTGRLNADRIKAKLGDDLARAHYFVVGPEGMVNGSVELLRNAGVPGVRIRTEEFAGY